MYFKIISLLSLNLFGENRLVKSFKLLPLSIKSINPTQKYLHSTKLGYKSISCDRRSFNVFVACKFFDFFGNVFDFSSRFITYALSFILLGKLSRE